MGTRRAKYGPRGHGGVSITYRRTTPEPTAANIQEARDWISSARRACQLMLPDPQAHRAIDCLDEAEHLLGGPPAIKVT